jgi:hypothetical protein
MINQLFDYTSSNENADEYGKRYWGVILNDGRYMYIHADKLIVNESGDLIALRKIASSNEHDGSTQMTFCLAKGQWLSFFAANVLTGYPVCVDNTVSVSETTKKRKVSA